MDTRVGYPNEHLAKGSDELKSPMYATGVGLVIKGFHEIEKKKKGAIENSEENKKSMKRKETVVQPKIEHSLFTFISELFKEERDKPLDGN
jgi:cell division protein FtsA